MRGLPGEIEEMDIHSLLRNLLAWTATDAKNPEQALQRGATGLGGDSNVIEGDFDRHGPEPSEKKRSRHHLAVPGLTSSVFGLSEFR